MLSGNINICPDAAKDLTTAVSQIHRWIQTPLFLPTQLNNYNPNSQCKLYLNRRAARGLDCDLPFNEVLCHGRLDFITLSEGGRKRERIFLIRWRRRSCFGKYRPGKIRFTRFRRICVFIKDKLEQIGGGILALTDCYFNSTENLRRILELSNK